MSEKKLPVHLSTGEKVLLTYESAIIKRLFGSNIVKYLSVTNKRILYYSNNRDRFGDRTKVLEMPIDDVAYIDAGVGQYTNWLVVLAATGILTGIIKMVFEFLPKFTTHWAVGVALLLPYVIMVMFERQILNRDIEKSLRQNIDKSAIGGFVKSKGQGFFQQIFTVSFLIGLFILLFHFGEKTPGLNQLLTVAIAAVSFRYCYKKFGSQQMFHLLVGSKSAEGMGININTDTSTGSRYKIYVPTPGKDCEKITRELGASISEIQTKGSIKSKKVSSAKPPSKKPDRRNRK